MEYSNVQKYDLAVEAYNLIAEDGHELAYLEAYVDGVSDMVNPDFTLKAENDFRVSRHEYSVRSYLDEIINHFSYSYTEDKELIDALNLIFRKCMFIMHKLMTNEEFNQWVDDTLTNWGGRGDL